MIVIVISDYNIYAISFNSDSIMRFTSKTTDFKTKYSNPNFKTRIYMPLSHGRRSSKSLKM